MDTTVGIVGGGPAGLLLARLLRNAGIASVTLESRDRGYVESRQGAGILEQGTVDVLRSAGVGERMDREGMTHDGIELRFDRRAHRLDFLALTGGRSVLVYPQAEVVKDLIARQLRQGDPLLFEAEVLAVEGADTDRPVVRFLHEGRERTLSCDCVVGCDGADGVTRTAIPESVRTTYEQVHPYSWLGILAEAPPVYDELIYAHSGRGFALAGMRSATVSSLCLQVPNGTDPADWPDDRVWDELDARFALDSDPGWQLRRGPVVAKTVLPLRSSVTEPMRYGRVFLAGDAAHAVSPTGAKGLDLAASDVITLARALIHEQNTGSAELLDAYSDTCLRRVWRAEYFSYSMTTMLHTDPAQSAFDTRLQLAQLNRLATSRHAAAELADNYTGLPVG
ncbi:4-hydroxybenzoate 3-monooxygenase [Streptomyces sp. NBC_00306]|uniref:4-hydroxybenzoate 3-monooxygenase n=1 Tax=Streptomyces sp. NBC_00306 TaxID=2975708 RepID=UPI002E283404|nr:4-hydroxybenzoate 3-monooxygenase [Streptomyces sp. NBC_00306]